MVLSTFIYGILGLGIMIAGFIILDIAIPYDFRKEIFEEKNPAVGIMAAGLFVALAIIIRSAIL